MKKTISKKLPEYCDYSCEYASFTKNCLSGACRRESAIFCSLAGKYNNKNGRCLVSVEGRIGETEKGRNGERVI